MNEHNTFKNSVRRVWSRFSSRFSARFCAWFFLSLHLRKILLQLDAFFVVLMVHCIV